MFVLRPEHEKAFREASLRRFAKKVVRMLRRDQRKAALKVKDAELLTCVNRWIEFAHAHNIRTEQDIYSLCEASVLFQEAGLDICTIDVVRILLSDHHMLPAERASSAKQFAIEFSSFAGE